MRNVIALMVAVLLLVSHGGFAGATPHLDHAHGHAHPQNGHHLGGDYHGDHEHDAPSQESSDLSNTSDLPSSHSAPHGHAVLGMPEAGAIMKSRRLTHLLPAPLATVPLIGTEAPPLIEPPSA